MSEEGRGLYEGLCNRMACLQPGATWYNHSTRKYYCWRCATLINFANPEAVREYGTQLCTEGKNDGLSP